jgi:hypothetical protein
VTDDEIRSAKFSLVDAQSIVARWYDFESWQKLADFVEAVTRKGASVAQFESAVEAIIAGDVATLQSLLRDNPELVRARSMREHGATLLLYVGANLVEGYRGYNPLTAALANGRPEAAEFLANRGARLNIEGAAGLGMLDLVERFFNEDGSPKSDVTKEQKASALIHACLYGRTSVAEFLLEKGVDPAAGANVGQTGLHYAAHGGHLDTVKLLLEREAPLEVLNVYGGTVLGQATWSVMNGDPSIDYVSMIETLLDAGANAEAADYPTGNDRVDDLLRRHGAKS